MTIKPLDQVWLHLRKDMLPIARRSKLLSRGNIPLRILEKIDDKAYKHELPDEFGVHMIYNVSNLSWFDASKINELEMRKDNSQDDGNDKDTRTNMHTSPDDLMTRSRELQKFQQDANLFRIKYVKIFGIQMSLKQV